MGPFGDSRGIGDGNRTVSPLGERFADNRSVDEHVALPQFNALSGKTDHAFDRFLSALAKGHNLPTTERRVRSATANQHAISAARGANRQRKSLAALSAGRVPRHGSCGLCGHTLGSCANGASHDEMVSVERGDHRGLHDSDGSPPAVPDGKLSGDRERRQDRHGDRPQDAQATSSPGSPCSTGHHLRGFNVGLHRYRAPP